MSGTNIGSNNNTGIDNGNTTNIFGSPDQHQGQGEGQGQLNLQGQLEGQGQGQLEGQGQGQSQSQSAFDANANGNGNLNGNGNGNLNGNGNFNADANLNGNANFDANGNLNINTNFDSSTAIATAVASSDAVSNGVTQGGLIDFANMDLAHLSGGLFNIVDNNSQPDATNAFNIDQVNSLVANNFLGDASVSYSAGDSSSGYSPDVWGDSGHGNAPGFSMDASISHSGNGISNDASAGAGGAAGTATADVALTQSAFTQSVVLGANIQFNSLTLSNVGGDSTTATGSHDMVHH